MYIYPPVEYIEPVFRPPSEANSLILQVTNGCSWNNCTFCEMYTAPQKKFRPKAQQEIEAEIQRCSTTLTGIRRIFLADGDAMALSFKRLKDILLSIRQYMPDVSRVSAYCLPRNLKNKSVDELAELYHLGLKLLYVGAESGDNTVLEKISKGETFDSTRDALLKVSASGIKTSMMVINGMGGTQYSEQHAIYSAKLANETQPDYLATLVLYFNGSKKRVEQGFDGQFQELNQHQLFTEMEIFLDTLTLEKTIFRSDHASNYLVLKGILNRDKAKLLQQVRGALSDNPSVSLRSEYDRGL